MHNLGKMGSANVENAPTNTISMATLELIQNNFMCTMMIHSNKIIPDVKVINILH
jgi:hypothetical protein